MPVFTLFRGVRVGNLQTCAVRFRTFQIVFTISQRASQIVFGINKQDSESIKEVSVAGYN